MKSSTAGRMTLPVADRLPGMLRVYRALTAAAAPLTPILLSYRLRRGKEDPARLRERRGETNFARPPGSLVWVHGASVGEITAVLPLIEHIRAQGLQVLVTSGTVTSAELAQQRLPPGAIHQFVPLDAPQFVNKFLDHWRPDLALFVESDLWPNLILAAAARNIPLVLVNGRLSQRSFKRWSLIPRTFGSVLQRLDLCLAQSQADASRYSLMGGPRVTMTGNLKLDVPAPPVDPAELAAIKSSIGERTVFAAASTHPGEEMAVIDAHRRLRQSFPGLLTMIAPRHPDRGSAVAELAATVGMAAALRSRGEKPDAGIDIYVADTVGELGLLYRLAPIVFMGGSLVGHGGQNPIEAAKLGTAILHGPHVWNFADIYSALDEARAARQVADAEALVTGVGAWLGDSAGRNAAAEAGHRTVAALGGALACTLQALDPYFTRIRLERGSRDA
jgi:3-deoxy-D-manno-octulosonic-acid transferase